MDRPLIEATIPDFLTEVSRRHGNAPPPCFAKLATVGHTTNFNVALTGLLQASFRLGFIRATELGFGPPTAQNG